MELRVAIAQFAPEVLDLRRSVAKACRIIAEAGKQKVGLLAFPETWIPVYPVWADLGTFSQWDHPDAKRLHARLHANALQVGSAEFRQIAAAARRARVWTVLGANERVGKSIYNALFFFSDRGELVGHRRKLVPTFGERLVWGYGDAHDLRAIETPFGRIGGLICWEHWMPPARQVLHQEGEVIHVAAWPHVKERHQIASRHYAFEGRAFVLAAGMVLHASHFPRDYELREELDRLPDVLIDGGSAIVGPDGEYIVPPVTGREALITADIDTRRAIEEALTLDVGGHYSRPDVFRVEVTRIRP
jgi:predicted amidohydrolase